VTRGAGARPLWIGTSWKMNLTRAEALAWCDAVAPRLEGLPERVRLFVVPPVTSLSPVAERLAGTRWTVGAQNLHWEDAGAWTGEVSAPMLADCGATLAEIGHSERRRWFGETDETVALKTAAALRHGLLPLVCVGETAEEREAGGAAAALLRQAAAAIEAAGDGSSDGARRALGDRPGGAGGATGSGRSSATASTSEGIPLLLAYEPVWAIGAGGEPATPAYVSERVCGLRDVVGDAPILYGGSVDPVTAGPMLAEGAVDGLFVGRAALKPDGFVAIAKLATR
jgi:triosephosphate isomerase